MPQPGFSKIRVMVYRSKIATATNDPGHYRQFVVVKQRGGDIVGSEIWGVPGVAHSVATVVDEAGTIVNRIVDGRDR